MWKSFSGGGHGTWVLCDEGTISCGPGARELQFVLRFAVLLRCSCCGNTAGDPNGGSSETSRRSGTAGVRCRNVRGAWFNGARRSTVCGAAARGGRRRRRCTQNGQQWSSARNRRWGSGKASDCRQANCIMICRENTLSIQLEQRKQQASNL